MRVSIIAAVATNRVIGRDGGLPWRLPADMRFFKRTTMGHHLLMGRKTWASIGRPLPGRTMVVLTRDRDARILEAVVAHGLAEALERVEAAGDSELFVIGGAEIYALALPYADRLLLTRVEAAVPGDVVFPEYDAAAWVEVDRQEHPADERHAYPFAICTLERASGA
ncbi:MAG: dihydrofolate reductase [Myxococcota bacterium]